ncbi:MAG: flagellar export protein FliJ [Treponema sp.]|nr:flagellar export protein FliJ [Treponema sp.]
MKKFSYELQDVLDYRNFQQDQAEAELSKALAVENEINESLALIAQRMVSLKQESKGLTDFNLISNQYNFVKVLEAQKEEYLKRLAEAKLVTDEKRAALQECIKKTTPLEKLKEKQFDEYRQTALKEENNNLEELSTIKNNFQN